MAPNQAKKKQQQIAVESSMAGVLALLVEEREERTKESKSAQKIEVLLSTAGMSVDDIAAVTGKKQDTVRKAIQRGRTT